MPPDHSAALGLPTQSVGLSNSIVTFQALANQVSQQYAPYFKTMNTLANQVSQQYAPYFKTMNTLANQVSQQYAPYFKTMNALANQVSQQYAPYFKTMNTLANQVSQQYAPYFKTMNTLASQVSQQYAPYFKTMNTLANQVSQQYAPYFKTMNTLANQVSPRHTHTLGAKFAEAMAHSFPLAPLAVRMSSLDPKTEITPARAIVRISRQASQQGPEQTLYIFDIQITNTHILTTTRQLFADKYYAIAVEKAFVCFENTVKELSGIRDRTGADLMFKVFNTKTPVLKLNELISDSDKNEQEGYMHMCAGAMQAVRNPRAHAHAFVDSPDTALKLLAWADYLMRILAETTYCPPEAN